MKVFGLAFTALIAVAILFTCETGFAAENNEKLQTECPVMGGAVDKSLYVDHEGKRIYVCCGGCINVVKKDPAKFIKKIEAQGVKLHKTPICPKCGEYKGTAKCCKTEGRVKCGKCGLLKGSPGCCKLPKVEKTICPKCGEYKGTAKCCKAEGHVKCVKCGMSKGSPGCCKIMKKSDNMKKAICPMCSGPKGKRGCCGCMK